MTIKRRIMLFVTGAGFIASLLFSGVVFYELIEQPFDILDTQLEEEASRAIKMIEMKQGGSKSAILNVAAPETFSSWLKIYEQGSKRMLYQSELARQINLPPVKPGSSATAEAIVQDEKINLGQGNSQEVAFRIRTFEPIIDGKKLKVQIALSIVKLKDEIQELILGLVAGLVFSTLVLIVISYFVAGKILKPIGTMKNLARNISEKNLDQRIPVEEGRDEFNELARTINKMLDRLQFSFVRQRVFLFDTSHELKTPLTTMRLAIDEICSSEGMEDFQPSSKENLLRLNEKVLRMERLAKDLLNLSALEVLHSIDPRPVHLTEMLSSLIEDYRFLAEGRNIHTEIDIASQLDILGDEEKIKRAFSNILDNAIKYNVDGGRIKLTAKHSDVELSVTITNTGAGVAEAEIPKVFDQFYRGEKSRSTKHGGSGLGLAIVKRIVDLHGGKVNFESRQGDWTKVTVILPRFRGKIPV
jgi:two-component system OmpR family sensor kinase